MRLIRWKQSCLLLLQFDRNKKPSIACSTNKAVAKALAVVAEEVAVVAVVAEAALLLA